MEVLVMIAQFLVGLSIMVGLHELGHLLFAKLFGIRVENYIICFPPKIFRFQWGETEYALGTVPLGGAVSIAGMVDESLLTKNVPTAPQPWEFRAKPAWQRLLVMLGGIIVNIVTGILIYTLITFSVGDTYLSKDAVNEHGVVPNALGRSLGFQEGDQIVNISGQDFERFNDVFSPHTLLSSGGYYTVCRGDREVQIDIPANLVEKLAGQSRFVEPRIPFVVGEVLPEGGAAQAGLQAGDCITAVAGTPTPYFHQLRDALVAHKGQKITLTYARAQATYTTQASLDAAGRLGFLTTPLLAYQKKDYHLWQAISLGTHRALDVIRVNLIGLKKIFTGEVSASKSISGPIGIAQVFGHQFSWLNFWQIVGFLSIILAFTNLLPIPMLDGGHTVLILYEMITGRRVSDRFMIATQRVGRVILYFLIGYAITNDIYKLLSKLF